MDPHALMESITSMSEYFVAANTRTSFTDLAESGSLNSLASVGCISTASNHNSSSSPSSFNHHQQQQQQHQHQQQQQQHQSSNLNQQFSSNNIGASNSVHKSNIGNNDHLQQQHVNNSTIHSPSNQNNYHSNSGHYSSNTSNNNSSNNNMQLSSCRMSQPIRTQIPIHCYIEQLDACADMSDYNSSLNDSDLFNTSNSNLNIISSTSNNKPLNHHHHQNQQQNNHHQQPHLHQSKLALESVTNCTTTTNTNGTSNNSSLSALANSTSSLFNENNTNNNDDNNDLDNLDNPLDQLGSDSPLSIHLHQTKLSPTHSSVLSGRNHQVNSICGNNNIIDRHHQASSSYDNNHFQSCRETYAIVTSNVLYIDLVRTVLLQLGYSAMDLINAKATIQIKNWRPLALDQVTEDKRATVGEVLGDISTFVTLRIRLYSSVTQLPTEWTETMIRQVVLALTQTMSQLTLSKLCNISQPLISSIVRGGKKLGRRKCAEFGQWYMNYIKSAEARPSTMFCEGGGARLVFDKSREIPQLKAWFANNTKPSDELLEEYSKILNEHALRKDRPQVTGKALKNWWKNERQKLGIRQREIRGRPKLKRIE